MYLQTTTDLRRVLTKDLEDLRSGKITKSDARTRAYVARNIIDTLKIEIAASAMNLSKYEPVLLDASPEIHGVRQVA